MKNTGVWSPRIKMVLKINYNLSVQGSGPAADRQEAQKPSWVSRWKTTSTENPKQMAQTSNQQGVLSIHFFSSENLTKDFIPSIIITDEKMVLVFWQTEEFLTPLPSLPLPTTLHLLGCEFRFRQKFCNWLDWWWHECYPVSNIYTYPPHVAPWTSNDV